MEATSSMRKPARVLSLSISSTKSSESSSNVSRRSAPGAKVDRSAPEPRRSRDSEFLSRRHRVRAPSNVTPPVSHLGVCAGGFAGQATRWSCTQDAASSSARAASRACSGVSMRLSASSVTMRPA